jgi:NADH-quinone oxidoreductase subunit L
VAAATGRFVYNRIDQGVVDTIVDGSGSAAEGGGQVLRQLTSGKVQQYGALLFGATAIFAGVLIFVV